MHINITACWMCAMENEIQLFPQPGDENSPLIAFEISCCEFFHKPVDLLGLSGEPKALQEHP